MDITINAVLESSPVETVALTHTFEDVYRAEYPNLVAVAVALTGIRGDGEDLVQDTMVKAYMRWDRVRTLDRPGAWCHRVLLNACRSLFRRRRTERRYGERLRIGDPEVSDVSADVLAFWQVVRSFPERPRRAVALYYAGDRTAVEIAELLGCPVGTIYSDLNRARAVLAEHLGY